MKQEGAKRGRSGNVRGLARLICGGVPSWGVMWKGGGGRLDIWAPAQLASLAVGCPALRAREGPEKVLKLYKTCFVLRCEEEQLHTS